MARFEKSRPKSAKPNAPVTAATTSRRSPARGSSIEDTMFFPRLRRHAKWMFVFLALVFGLGFVAFGVGAGGVGFGDILRGGGGGTGASVSDARKRTTENPKDPEAWRALATAQQAAGDLTGAAGSLNEASRLRPNDIGILRELAAAYQAQADEKQREAQLEQLVTAFAAPSNPAGGLTVQSTRVIGTDPITSAVQAARSSALNEAFAAASTASASAVSAYQRIAVLEPDDPNVQLELAEAAGRAGSTEAAIAAYERFLVLAPDDPLVSEVKRILKQLKPAPAKKN
jgi:tetratricopeptide (TPR) repeat protein